MAATVLLCDPSHDQREMYAEALHHAGFNVIECADGRPAFDIALQTHLAAIVTEVGADGAGCGWRLIERLRHNLATAGVPIIALVSREIVHDRCRALEVGVDRCFITPLAPEDLLTAISALVPVVTRVNWRQ
jgi:DNA-binding response OmpR family regulator